jgi:hypothetical protein
MARLVPTFGVRLIMVVCGDDAAYFLVSPLNVLYLFLLLSKPD